MKYFIITGEASGDLHGANLMKALTQSDSDCHFVYCGGDRMASHGGQPIIHYKKMAFMGFVEVVKHLPEILSNFKIVKKAIQEFKPDLVILIDYPGFNLRMAKWCKEQGLKVCYYIAPQVWAWNKKRVFDIKKYVDLLVAILPFEPEFFDRYGVKAQYVGHPLLDEISVFKTKNQIEENIPKDTVQIALLPGSRRQEIDRLLPIYLATAALLPTAYHYWIPKASALEEDVYWRFLKNYPNLNVTLSEEGTYPILQRCKAALVTSGTATLETALMGVPQIVCYKTSNLSYQIAKRIITLKYISLVNLIADQPLVEEQIQDQCTPEILAPKLKGLLSLSNSERNSFYDQLMDKMGGLGASQRAADLMVDFLKK